MKKILFLVFVAACASSMNYGMNEESNNSIKIWENTDCNEILKQEKEKEKEKFVTSLENFIATHENKNNLPNIMSYKAKLSLSIQNFAKTQKTDDFLDQLFTCKMHSNLSLNHYLTQENIHLDDVKAIDTKILDIHTMIISNETEKILDQKLPQQTKQIKNFPRRWILNSLLMNIGASLLAQHFNISGKKTFALFGLINGIYQWKQHKNYENYAHQSNTTENGSKKHVPAFGYHAIDLVFGSIGFACGRLSYPVLKNGFNYLALNYASKKA